jgi:hypothetical protein
MRTPVASSSFVYDAVTLFGFGEVSPESLPEAEPGELVLCYGGWSLQELRDSAIGQKLMRKQDWYDQYAWSSEKLPSGIYRLRVPVPNSNRKTFAEQEAMPPKGETIAPVVLVASALLAHRLHTSEALLKGDFTRCKEQLPGGNRVVLYWREGRLCVNHRWDDCRREYLWSSSVRTSESCSSNP